MSANEYPQLSQWKRHNADHTALLTAAQGIITRAEVDAATILKSGGLYSSVARIWETAKLLIQGVSMAAISLGIENPAFLEMVDEAGIRQHRADEEHMAQFFCLDADVEI
jgi:hypothetical protein